MSFKERCWQWVHNCVAHPIEGWIVLFTGYRPVWVEDFHRWAVPSEWKD